MAKEEGNERRDPVTDAESRDSAPPSSEQPESRDDARSPDSGDEARSPDSGDEVRAGGTGSEPATKGKEIDDRGESSGAFWFVVVGGAALAGWYLMHSSDSSTKTSTLVQPAMVEQAMEPGQPQVPEPALAPAPPPPAIPTPSAGEPGGTVTAGGTADNAGKPGTEQAAVAAGAPFDRAAALKALSASGAKAARCRSAGAPAGSTSVIVSLEPSGKVKSAKIVTAPYVGTPTATCITNKIAETTVAPFSGEAETISVPVQVY